MMVPEPVPDDEPLPAWIVTTDGRLSLATPVTGHEALACDEVLDPVEVQAAASSPEASAEPMRAAPNRVDRRIGFLVSIGRIHLGNVTPSIMPRRSIPLDLGVRHGSSLSWHPRVNRTQGPTPPPAVCGGER
jgi:hypothetical protein